MRSWMIGVVTAYILAGFMPVLLPNWGAVSLAIMAAMLWRCRFPGALFICGILLGFAAGNLYGHRFLEHRLASNCEARLLALEGEVASLPRRSNTYYGKPVQRFEFRVDKIEPVSCRGPKFLQLSYYGEMPIHPGERWQFSVKLKKPWGLANLGSFNMQSWYAQNAIDGIGNVRGDNARLLSPGKGITYQQVRQRVSEQIDQLALGDDVRGILRALTVADKSGMDGRLWTTMQFYGINHLLVISGLHISIVAGVGLLLGSLMARVVFLLGCVRVAAMIPGLLALGFALAYAALAGFGLATIRALCMLACFVAASLLGRTSLPGNKLLIAGLIILLVNPLSAIGSGFWLSFSAVACLLWLGMWRIDRRLPLRLLHTHVYMALAMIPLGGWWFGGVSQLAVVANLFMVPLVGLFIVPVALLAVVFSLLGLPGEQILWQGAAWPLEGLLPAAFEFAEQYGDLLYTYLSPSAEELVLGVAALALSVVPLPNALKIIIPILAVPLFLPQIQGAGKPTRLAILDVGQGTAVVLQSGDNTLVYDTGGGDPNGRNMANMVVLPYLRAQGVRAINTLLISHQDNDHSAGAQTLLRSIPVNRLLVGGDATRFRGAKKCRAGEAWRWPTGVSFQILSPESNTDTSSNNNSCVLQVRIGDTRLLLPGDIAAQREKVLVAYWRDELASDLLLAAHHGSQTSSAFAWLKTVHPAHAFLSYGYLNQFGHPHQSVRDRYAQLGVQTWHTAQSGALQIDFDPNGSATVMAFRNRWLPYWM